MRVARSEFRKGAFVLTMEAIDRICGAFEQHVGAPTINIGCSDSLSRTFDSLADFRAFENPKSKAILGLTIDATSRDYSQRAKVSFSSRDSDPIYIDMNGDEATIVPISTVIDEQLQHVRPWYALLTRVNFLILLFAVLVLVLLSLAAAGAVGLVTWTRSTNAQPLKAEPIGYLIGASPFIFGVVLNWLRATLFPTAVFSIGQGVKRHQDRELLRTVIVLGFVISLVASIVAALIL